MAADAACEAAGKGCSTGQCFYYSNGTRETECDGGGIITFNNVVLNQRLIRAENQLNKLEVKDPTYLSVQKETVSLAKALADVDNSGKYFSESYAEQKCLSSGGVWSSNTSTSGVETGFCAGLTIDTTGEQFSE